MKWGLYLDQASKCMVKCDQIWRNFTTLAKCQKSLAIFKGWFNILHTATTALFICVLYYFVRLQMRFIDSKSQCVAAFCKAGGHEKFSSDFFLTLFCYKTLCAKSTQIFIIVTSLGSGSGSEGRAVISHTGGPQFKSRQNFIKKIVTVNCWNMKIKKKKPRNQRSLDSFEVTESCNFWQVRIGTVAGQAANFIKKIYLLLTVERTIIKTKTL